MSIIYRGVFSLVPRLSTWHCTHLLMKAVLRRRCFLVPALAAVNWYLQPALHSAANQPHAAAAVDRWDRQTDRRTDGPSTYSYTLLRILRGQCQIVSWWSLSIFCLAICNILPTDHRSFLRCCFSVWSLGGRRTTAVETSEINEYSCNRCSQHMN